MAQPTVWLILAKCLRSYVLLPFVVPNACWDIGGCTNYGWILHVAICCHILLYPCLGLLYVVSTLIASLWSSQVTGWLLERRVNNRLCSSINRFCCSDHQILSFVLQLVMRRQGHDDSRDLPQDLRCNLLLSCGYSNAGQDEGSKDALHQSNSSPFLAPHGVGHGSPQVYDSLHSRTTSSLVETNSFSSRTAFCLGCDEDRLGIRMHQLWLSQQ